MIRGTALGVTATVVLAAVAFAFHQRASAHEAMATAARAAVAANMNAEAAIELEKVVRQQRATIGLVTSARRDLARRNAALAAELEDWKNAHPEATDTRAPDALLDLARRLQRLRKDRDAGGDGRP